MKSKTFLGKVGILKSASFVLQMFRSFYSSSPMKEYSLTVELTYKCNAKCGFCARWNTKEEEMSLELIEKIFKEASESGCWFVSLTGGELLLRSDFPEILRLVKEYNLMASINTNGILLAKYADLITQYSDNILSVNLSLHACKPDIHDDIIGVKGGFDKIIKGINLLKDKVDIKLAVTVTSKNITELMDIAEYANSNSLDYRFNPVHDDRQNQLSIWDTGYNFEIDASKVEALIADYIQKYSPEFRYQIFYRLFPAFWYTPGKLLNLRCIAAARTMYLIDSVGNIYPCESRRDILLGNVNQASLNDILNSKASRIWRTKCKKRQNGCICMYSCVAPTNLLFEFFPLFPLSAANGFPINFLWESYLRKLR